jgi:hypothetical protein
MPTRVATRVPVDDRLISYACGSDAFTIVGGLGVGNGSIVTDSRGSGDPGVPVTTFVATFDCALTRHDVDVVVGKQFVFIATRAALYVPGGRSVSSYALAPGTGKSSVWLSVVLSRL